MVTAYYVFTSSVQCETAQLYELVYIHSFILTILAETSIDYNAQSYMQYHMHTCMHTHSAVLINHKSNFNKAVSF